MKFTTCLTYIISASIASYGMITSYLLLFVNHRHKSMQPYPSEVAIVYEPMITTSKPTTTLKISTTQHIKDKRNPKKTTITTMRDEETILKTKFKMIEENVTEDPTIIFETSKYLLYGSSSGWANQLKSLEHAYWIAFATNRTLVLPPVLYHYDAIQKTYKDIEFKISKNKNKKKRTINDDQNDDDEEEEVEDSVSYYYNKLLKNSQINPKKKRIRMSSILDFDSWTNPVPVIDYESFVMDLNSSRTKNKNWMPKVKEFSVYNKFSCHFIKLTLNISKNDIEETAHSCQDHIGYNKMQPHTYKYRHIPTYLNQEQKYDIWSFQFVYPHALFDLDSMPSTLFQIHYTEPIRTARLELVQSWGKEFQEYAAIHIRGNDGPFKNSDWSTVIPNLVERTYQSIINYDSVNNKTINDNVHHEKHHYTLVVVSDLPSAVWNGEKSEVYTIWKKEEHKLIDKLRRNNNNTNIELNVVITGNDNFYQNITKTLQQNLDGSYEAGVYFDQLLAACADISFVGSNVEVSTFQQRIVSMRQQTSSPCL